MSELRRSKSLRLERYRTRWSEEDLARLARVLQQETGKVGISVVAADGEDRLWTDNPEFFRGVDLPISVKEIALESVDAAKANAVRFEVGLGLGGDFFWTKEPATAKVSGEGPIVISLFRTLEKEFSARTLPGARLVRFLHGVGGLLVTYMICATVLVSSYYLLASLVLRRPLQMTTLPDAITLIVGTGAMLAVAVVLTGRVGKLLTRSFPMIEFSGRLAASNRFQRAALVWAIIFVLLPFILNVVAGIVLRHL